MPTRIDYTIADEKGLNSVFSVDVPDGFTLLQYQNYADALATGVEAITAGQILGARMSVALTLAGAPFAAAIEGADVEEKALFVFRGVNGFLKRMTIPAVDEAIVNQNGTINTADASVAAWLSNIVAGDGTIAATDYRGDDLTSLVEARKYFGRDRGG